MIQWDDASLICKFFNNHKYPCWIDFGSLLGLVRDGGKISWDRDIDLSVIIDDLEVMTDLLRTYFLEQFYSEGTPEIITTYFKLHGNYPSGFSVCVDHTNKIFSIFDGIIEKSKRPIPWIDVYVIKEYCDDFLICLIEPVYFILKILFFL